MKSTLISISSLTVLAALATPAHITAQKSKNTNESTFTTESKISARWACRLAGRTS